MGYQCRGYGNPISNITEPDVVPESYTWTRKRFELYIKQAVYMKHCELESAAYDVKASRRDKLSEYYRQLQDRYRPALHQIYSRRNGGRAFTGSPASASAPTPALAVTDTLLDSG